MEKGVVLYVVSALRHHIADAREGNPEHCQTGNQG